MKTGSKNKTGDDAVRVAIKIEVTSKQQQDAKKVTGGGAVD